MRRRRCRPRAELDNDTYVQLLAINDFHGHLAANTPGSIQVGCCNPSKHGGHADRWTQKTVPAGGIEYLATADEDAARAKNTNTITVGAGDLIGASPLVSALFHDEPTIEEMNALGLDVTGVGNHEFDEGVNELLRMQFGGCHPVDGCQDGDDFAGAVFKYLAANVFYEGTDETIFPPYEIKTRRREDRVHRPDARGHADDRHADGRRRPGVQARGRDGQRARPEAPARSRSVKAFVVLLHQGGSQTAPAPVFPGPQTSRTPTSTSIAAPTSTARRSRRSRTGWTIASRSS